MGLDLPELDDRTYEELREDALKRLPVHAPEWTDHNAHDPGITILELLAWLVETYGYQLDRLTDSHRRRYLDLVGVVPRGPVPASGDVEISIDGPTSKTTLPAQTPIRVETPDRDQVRYETDHAVALTAAEIGAVVTEDARGRTDRTAANARDGRTFRPFGDDASMGNALYLGFRSDPFDENDRLDLTIDFADADIPGVTGDPRDPERFEPSIAVDWECLTNPKEWWLANSWADVAVLEDETNAFYEGGRIKLAPPAEWDGSVPPERILNVDTPLLWLRARATERTPNERSGEAVATCAEHPVAIGRSRPPRSRSDPQTEQYEHPPEFAWIRTNVVRVSQRERATGVALERIDPPGTERPPQSVDQTAGRSGQSFEFPKAPVQSADIAVGENTWTQVDDFAASGPDDMHYVLEREDGVITFGDGRRGAIPEPGQSVVATAIIYGGGARGNVSADARWSIEGEEALSVRPRLSPTGGRESETIPEALERARSDREVSHRVITATDYRDIAMRTPGVRVGRAEAIACPPTEPNVANEVTVVVVPYGPAGRRPVPTPGFLEAVEYQLCTHALLTDRVAVAAPSYVGVRVRVEVGPAESVPDRDVVDAVTERLESFIDPLTGFAGDGWPFDRPIHRSDVFEVLAELPEIDDVVDVALDIGDDADLEADHTTLPYLADVTVLVREDREKCGRGI